MRLPYATTFTLTTPTSFSATGYVFSANGMFDPDITGTGLQPMGFDQMMVFYEHYTVTYATIEATFRNFTLNQAPTVFLALRGDVTPATSQFQIMETGNTVSTQLMVGGIDGSMKKLYLTAKIGKFLGIRDLFDSSVARGDVAANPTEGVFFHVGAFNSENITSTSIYCQVRVVYQAIFTEARIITQSMTPTPQPEVDLLAMAGRWSVVDDHMEAKEGPRSK